MKQIVKPPALLLAASLALTPLAGVADETPPPANPDIAQGAEKLSEGLRLLFRGLMSESQKSWDELVQWLGDFSAYEPPERLPNGDILIRRKVPLSPGETDL